jgi:hypothetical protein
VSRVVNRVPTLRPPSRARHHYRLYEGPYKDRFAYALAAGYNPDFWRIPDDPLDPSAWVGESCCGDTINNI